MVLLRPVTRSLTRPVTRSVLGAALGPTLEQQVAAMLATLDDAAWYCPSEITSTYQEIVATSNGGNTLGVAGQDVGVLLDRAWGGGNASGLTAAAAIAAETELFDQSYAEGTVSGSNESYDSGTGYFTVIRNGSGTGAIQLVETLVEGQAYLLTYERSDGGGEAGHVDNLRINGAAAVTDQSFTGTESISRVIVAPASGSLTMNCPNTGFSWSIRNVSCKALPGYVHVAPATGQRPTLTADGSNHYLNFSGTDRLTTALSSPGSGWTAFVVVKGADTIGYLMNGQDNDHRYELVSDGSSDNASNNSGSPTHSVDNLALAAAGAATGAQMYDALMDDSKHVLKVTDLDLSLWTEWNMGGSTTPFDGEIHEIIMMKGATSEDEDLVQNYLAAKHGTYDTDQWNGGLVANGGFDADADWSKSTPGASTVTISGGTCTLQGASGEYPLVSQDILTVGNWYEMTIHKLSGATAAGADLEIRFGTGSGAYRIGSQPAGTYSVVKQASSTSSFTIIKRGSTTTPVEFDNVRVVETSAP